MLVNLIKLSEMIHDEEIISLANEVASEEDQAEAIIDFLSNHPSLKSLGMNDHIHIVGGAVRDTILGKKPKDIDIVVDEVSLNSKNKTALVFAKAIADIIPGLNSNTIVMDNYFVIHIGPFPQDFFWKGINLKGAKLEIVAARKESYEKGVGYKPTSVEKGNIRDDLLRRDFSINSLTAPLSKLEHGITPESVEDILGQGLDDLSNKPRERKNKSPKNTGLVKTPLDPDITFNDDPSRILRAIRFIFKYNFELDADTKEAIIKNKDSLKRIPWQPLVETFVGKILTLPNHMQALEFMSGTGLLSVIGEISKNEPGMQSRLSSMLKDLNITQPSVLIMLKKRGIIFTSPVSRTDALTDRKLLDYEEIMPELSQRLVRQNINYKELSESLGLKPKDIPELKEKIKQIIIDDPRKTDEEALAELKKTSSAKPIYLAVFLDESSRSKLLKHYPPIHSKTYAEHMTIAFGSEVLNYPAALIGKQVSLKVIGYKEDELGQAVVVSGVSSSNKTPHITISSNAPPKYSNEMLSSGFEPAVNEIELTGTIDYYPRMKTASQKVYIFDLDDTLFHTEPWHSTIETQGDIVVSPGESILMKKALEFISQKFPKAYLKKESIVKSGNDSVRFVLVQEGQNVKGEEVKKVCSFNALRAVGFKKDSEDNVVISSDPEFYNKPETLGTKPNDSVFKIFAENVDHSIVLTARQDIEGMEEGILERIKSLTGKAPSKLYLKPNSGSTSSAQYKADVILDLMKDNPTTEYEFWDDNQSYLDAVTKTLQEYDLVSGENFSSRIILHKV